MNTVLLTSAKKFGYLQPKESSLNPSLAKSIQWMDALIDWESRSRTAMRQNLHPIADLMTCLNNPQSDMRFVHVTGTKGKGSVCSLIECSMIAAGLAVGRYASPHLLSITERISIHGSPIPEERLAGLINTVLSHVEAARKAGSPAADATWFDVLTAVALLAFREAGCSWVILEVGLGGRLDSTNVVDAEIAVLTNVELEHTEVLGRDRAAIAAEKAGIIKAGAVVVTPIADDEVGDVIAQRAVAIGARVLRLAHGAVCISDINRTIAGAVLDELGRRGVMSAGPVPKGVGNWLLSDTVSRAAALPGRMERLRVRVATHGEGTAETISVVLDGAHVPFNLRAVLAELSQDPLLASRCVAVFATGEDKDLKGLLEVLSLRSETVFATSLRAPGPTTPPGKILDAGRLCGLPVTAVGDPHAALNLALVDAARRGTWVLITGSLHLVGLLRPSLVASIVEHQPIEADLGG